MNSDHVTTVCDTNGDDVKFVIFQLSRLNCKELFTQITVGKLSNSTWGYIFALHMMILKVTTQIQSASVWCINLFCQIL